MAGNFKLINRIIALSDSNVWDIAKKEWVQIGISYREKGDFGECICGKYPIVEEISMYNNITKNKAIVGNCCIKKFFDLENFDKVFKALKKNKVNAFMISDCYEKGLISNWENHFMLELWRKRNLSYKQQQNFDKIKNKILRNYKNIPLIKEEPCRNFEKVYPDFATFLREYRE